jgi:hypothetical protein
MCGWTATNLGTPASYNSCNLKPLRRVHAVGVCGSPIPHQRQGQLQLRQRAVHEGQHDA